MKKPSNQSAGILLFRSGSAGIEVLLVHPGGPFWARKNEGAWMIPKGAFTDEAPLDAARREFQEEIGFMPEGDFIELTPILQRGGKRVFAWALEGVCDPATIRSNTFSMEWPPKSGTQQTFPEIDRAEWFTLETAGKMILDSQRPLLDELQEKLLYSGSNQSKS